YLSFRVFDPSGKTHWHSGGFASVVCDLLKALFTIGFCYRPKRHETRTRRRADRTLTLTLLKNARIADQNNTPSGKPYASHVGGEMEGRRALFLQIAVAWRVDKCIYYMYAFCVKAADGAVATAAEPTAAAMVSHSKRDSRHFSRRCRVSRDGERYFSPIRVYTRSRANTLRIAPRGDWYATGKVDTRDLRTLQTINICATNSKRHHLDKKCCANNLSQFLRHFSGKNGGIILVAWRGRRHRFIERFFLAELKSLKTRTITKIKDSRTYVATSATKNRPLSPRTRYPPLRPACGILAPIPDGGDAAGDAVTTKSVGDLPAFLCNLGFSRCKPLYRKGPLVNKESRREASRRADIRWIKCSENRTFQTRLGERQQCSNLLRSYRCVIWVVLDKVFLADCKVGHI
ncbi:hypothetical protein ALC57_06672, partial [Trachymyrmex cornetzi]